MFDMEINLKNLLKSILKQWRVLIISMLVFAIILTVAGAVSSLKQRNEAQKALDAQLANGGPQEGETLVVVPKLDLVNVKKLVLGAAIGFVLVAGYVVVVYAASSKLRCAADMVNGFSVSVMGIIKLEREKKKFDAVDNLIDNIFREDKDLPKDVNIQIISTDIAMAAKKKGIRKLFFTGAADKRFVQQVIHVLEEADKEKTLEITCEKLAIYSPEGLEAMLNSEGVVLFESIGRSSFKDINKELEYCKRYDIPVLGSVVID